jgi:MYXO-CTERM domain-containing protein
MIRARGSLYGTIALLFFASPAFAENPQAAGDARADELYFSGPGGGDPLPADGGAEAPPNECTCMEDGLAGGCACSFGAGRASPTRFGLALFAVAALAVRRATRASRAGERR